MTNRPVPLRTRFDPLLEPAERVGHVQPPEPDAHVTRLVVHRPGQKQDARLGHDLLAEAGRIVDAVHAHEPDRARRRRIHEKSFA